MSDKRSFTIVSVKNSQGKILSQFKGGRYLSSTPLNASKKTISQICRDNNTPKKSCSFTVTLKETTQGSEHKEYCYKVKRVYEPVIVFRNGVEITYNYKLLAYSC